MRYRDLKEERDAAVARAVEAERLSMKSEFDRVTAEFEHEKSKMTMLAVEATRIAYRNGFNAGINAMADDISDRLKHRTELVPPSLKVPSEDTISVWASEKSYARRYAVGKREEIVDLSPTATTGSRVAPGDAPLPAEAVGDFQTDPPSLKPERTDHATENPRTP